MDGQYGSDNGNPFGGPAGGDAPDQNERRGDGMISEMARRAVSSSVSKLIETEGFIREVVKMVSREIAGYVSREMRGLRQEMVQQVGASVVGWLEKVDVAGEVRKGLNGLTFDIQMRVHVTDEGVDVKSGKTGAKTAAKKKAATRKPPSAGGSRTYHDGSRDASS